jgi:class 3 adenylate cyclase
MRQLLLLLFCLSNVCGFAQLHLPAFHKYSLQYYFIDSNRYLHQNSLSVIADSVKRMEQIAEDSGDPEFAGALKLFRYIKEFRERKVSPDTIEHNLLRLYTYASDNTLKYLEADVLQALGDFYSDNNQKQSAAIENYVLAYSIYKNFTADEYPTKQANIYTLGGMYYRYEDYDNAIKYMQGALRLKQSTNKNIFCSISNTIGMAYRQMGWYDSAIVYFQRTYENALTLNNDAWAGIAQGNIGITYFRQKRYAEAVPLLQKDIESSLSTNNIRNGAGSMAILATIYIEQREYAKAEKILREALSIVESKPFWPYYPLGEQLFTQMSKVYAAKKDYRLAYLYADSALVAKDSAARRNSAITLSKAQEKQNFIEQKLQEEKYQNQVKISTLELSKKRIEMTFTFIGIAILLAVIFFIARERKRSENLLLNILPEKIADRLKRKEHPIADYFDHASIIFIDMAGFTLFSDGRDPKEIVNILNHVFTSFDNIAERHGLEKIKTIGDCYMAVSGLPDPQPNHAEAATQMALDIRAEMRGYKAADGTPIEFRVGLDCGPVVAGVIGRRKFIYDLWGDTVNTASRMESTGLAGEIHCTDRFKKIIEANHRFKSRGQTEVKGKGMMDTWLIVD